MPVYITPDDTLYAAPAAADSGDTEMEGPKPAAWYVADRATGEWVADESLYERARKIRIRQVDRQLALIDDESHSDRTWREYVIAHADDYPDSAVARMQAAEDAAALLRAHRADLTNAVFPDLPGYDDGDAL